jgi:hypothetical protein
MCPVSLNDFPSGSAPGIVESTCHEMQEANSEELSTQLGGISKALGQPGHREFHQKMATLGTQGAVGLSGALY